MPTGDRAFLIVLGLAVAFVYVGGLGAPPAFDDALLATYPATHGSWEGVVRAFLHPVPASFQGVPLPAYAYRPLTETSFVLNAALGGGSHLALRLGNLLIHLGASCLVFLLARRLAGIMDRGRAWFPRLAALLFAVHPLGVQAVTYVYQRAVALEALLMFATLLLYWKAREGHRGAYVGAMATGLLAMTAKEPAVTLPLALAALEWILPTGQGFGKALRRWAPFALMPLLVGVQILRALDQADALGTDRYRESGIHAVGYGFSRWEYFRLELPILVRYLTLAAWPFPLTFYFDRVNPLPGQAAVIPWVPVLAAGALLAAGGLWVLFGARRHALGRLGLALFFTPLLLESTIFPIQDLAFQHRCYPSLLGAGLLLAQALAGRRILGVAALGLMASLTLLENRVWADSRALLARDVRHAFHRTTIWTNLGWHDHDAGHPEAAESFFRHALRSPWQTQRTRVGLACALRAQGREEAARRVFEQAFRAYPKDTAILWVAVGHALEDGDEARLEDLAGRAEALPLLRPELAMWLAARRLEQGRADAAAHVMERQLAVFPAHPQFWDLLGRARELQGRMPEAVAAWRKALALDPGLEATRRDLLRAGAP